MNEQEKQDTTQDNESLLTDLEPVGDVKGGGTFTILNHNDSGSGSIRVVV